MKHSRLIRPQLVFLLLASIIFSRGISQEIRIVSRANVVSEVTFTAQSSWADPFNQVTLDVVFTDPQGHKLRVPAFWAGTNIWKARYASPVLGTHRFRSECSTGKDPGLDGITGYVEIKPYRGTNILYAHGPLRSSLNHRFLEHADGTPFFWLGDTWWMGLCQRWSWPEDFMTLCRDRKEKGFNLIQIVAGLYPDMHPFDPRGANEGGYPWETNYARIRPEYFNAADRRLFYLADEGFVPCLVGAWGYFLPWMGVEKAKEQWRYLVARYGALPVVWCVAGEANLPWYLAPGFPYDDRQQVKDWTQVTAYLRQIDPFHRLITIHPTGIGRLSARNAIDDLSLIDIDMLQTPHGRQEAVAPTVRTVRESYQEPSVLPVINGEASYEMLFDNLPTEWTRRMFWLSIMNGAAGHTYGANGIWQVNRRGRPHGPSPHHKGGDGYGRIPWEEALHLPGSRQVGLGKKLLEEYAWPNFQPHPEWASFSSQSNLSFAGCHWIWYPEGHSANDAPAGKRYFRRSFILPNGKKIVAARLRLSVDDYFQAQVNGTKVGASRSGPDSWRTARQFDDIAPFLKPGKNIIAIAAENLPAPGANPAGLIARLEITFEDGERIDLNSDSHWLCAKAETPNWERAESEPTGWVSANIVASYGEAPWGFLDRDETIYGPQSAGFDRERIIYVPLSIPILVHNLAPGVWQRVTYFDPVTGDKQKRRDVKADSRGVQTFPSPAHDHDWILILESKK